MAFLMKIAIDAMGGDNAPVEIIKGAVNAANERPDVAIVLVGQEEVVTRELEKLSYNKEQIEVVDAREIIKTGEPPVAAVRGKKDSSLVKALYLVRRGEADAFISAGSTGAVLVGGQTVVGRAKKVERAPLAQLFPTESGLTLLVDCGANVDAKPSNLVQFARMGSIYMEHVVGIKNPRVAIVNIGAEEEKGNALVKETYPMLKECKDINFIGNIEARDIPKFGADVVVCDAFVGNVILKLYEGLASTLMKLIKQSMMATTRGKIGGMLVKPGLKEMYKAFDASEYGGAPLLGLNGLVVKAHGNSTAKEIRNAIMQCLTYKEQMISEWMRESISGEYIPALHGGIPAPENENEGVQENA